MPTEQGELEPDGLAAALNSRKRAGDVLGIDLAWIFDIPGELGITSGERTINWVERFAPAGSVGFGLGGRRSASPARSSPRSSPALGRSGWAAFPMRARPPVPRRSGSRSASSDRIGHGIAAVRDPELMAYLVDHGIALDVCPTSNVCTRAVADLGSHPLPDLIRAGVTVTVNSDDPGMFSTSLNREYMLVHQSMGLSLDDLTEVARAAVRVSFCSADVHRRLLAEIDAYAGPR